MALDLIHIRMPSMPLLNRFEDFKVKIEKGTPRHYHTYNGILYSRRDYWTEEVYSRRATRKLATSARSTFLVPDHGGKWYLAYPLNSEQDEYLDVEGVTLDIPLGDLRALLHGSAEIPSCDHRAFLFILASGLLEPHKHEYLKSHLARRPPEERIFWFLATEDYRAVVPLIQPLGLVSQYRYVPSNLDIRYKGKRYEAVTYDARLPLGLREPPDYYRSPPLDIQAELDTYT